MSLLTSQPPENSGKLLKARQHKQRKPVSHIQSLKTSRRLPCLIIHVRGDTFFISEDVSMVLLENTVGKHTPCKLSFVYTSYIRYGVRAAPKFGKRASLFLYHEDKKYV